MTQKAVGMGRAISDGVSDAYLQDVAVLSLYRNQGIGQKIVETLVEICHNSGIEWIGLVAQPGTVSLYHRCGFQILENHTPMKYEKTI
jgi:spermidine synthase